MSFRLRHKVNPGAASIRTPRVPQLLWRFCHRFSIQEPFLASLCMLQRTLLCLRVSTDGARPCTSLSSSMSGCRGLCWTGSVHVPVRTEVGRAVLAQAARAGSAPGPRAAGTCACLWGQACRKCSPSSIHLIALLLGLGTHPTAQHHLPCGC